MKHDTARKDILEAARRLKMRGFETFSPIDVVEELRRSGSHYKESTIRTHIVSRMCREAPVHHNPAYADLERVGPGKYRLLSSAGTPLRR